MWRCSRASRQAGSCLASGRRDSVRSCRVRPCRRLPARGCKCGASQRSAPSPRHPIPGAGRRVVVLLPQRLLADALSIASSRAGRFRVMTQTPPSSILSTVSFIEARSRTVSCDYRDISRIPHRREARMLRLSDDGHRRPATNMSARPVGGRASIDEPDIRTGDGPPGCRTERKASHPDASRWISKSGSGTGAFAPSPHCVRIPAGVWSFVAAT